MSDEFSEAMLHYQPHIILCGDGKKTRFEAPYISFLASEGIDWQRGEWFHIRAALKLLSAIQEVIQPNES